MEYAKLDPMLAAEVTGGAGGDRALPVFVHVADQIDDDTAVRWAERLGLQRPVTPGSVLTVTLPLARVGELSDEPWVVAIRAARRLRPLG